MPVIRNTYLSIYFAVLALEFSKNSSKLLQFTENFRLLRLLVPLLAMDPKWSVVMGFKKLILN